MGDGPAKDIPVLPEAEQRVGIERDASSSFDHLWDNLYLLAEIRGLKKHVGKDGSIEVSGNRAGMKFDAFTYKLDPNTQKRVKLLTIEPGFIRSILGEEGDKVAKQEWEFRDDGGYKYTEFLSNGKIGSSVDSSDGDLSLLRKANVRLNTVSNDIIKSP